MANKNSKVEVRLRRDLSLFDVTLMGIGALTGASIFVLAGVATHWAGPAVLLGIFLNFIITLLTALCYAELAGTIPEAGGGYLWVREGLPHPFGFVGGWISWFGHAIACSFYTIVFGTGIVWLLSSYGFHVPFISQNISIRIFAIILIIIFVSVNYIGTRQTGKAGDYVTLTQLAIMVTFIIFALIKAAHNPNIAQSFTPFLPEGFEGVVVSMGLLVVAFEGYEIIAQCAEETKNPEKTLPRAIFISVGFVAILYFLLLISAIGATSWQYIGGKAQFPGAPVSTDPTMMLINASHYVMPFGVGGTVMIIAMIAGTMATLNATLFSASRVSFAMARDGALPRWFSKIHRKRKTPHLAITFSGILIGAMALFLPITDIAAAADIMFLLLFTFVTVAVMTLRYKRPDLKRTFMVPLFPYIPIIGIIIRIFLGIFLFQFSPIAWYIALAWIEAGLIIYLVAGGKKDIDKAHPETFFDLVTPKPKPRKYHVMVSVVNEKSASLVSLGAQLAKERGGEISIVNVLEIPKSLPPSAIGFNEVNAHMKTVKLLEKNAKAEKIDVKSTVLISRNVPETILEEASVEDSDIIVLGWRGTSGRGRIFGSTIDAAVAKANCDVIVAKTETLRQPIGMILLLAGPEWHASYAAEVASVIAKKCGAEITVLGIAQSEKQLESVKKYTTRLVEICRTRGVKTGQKHMISKNIINSAITESDDYDLLVLGASEIVWAPSYVLMGLVEDRIAKGTAKPVIMVRKVRKIEKKMQSEGTMQI